MIRLSIRPPAFYQVVHNSYIRERNLEPRGTNDDYQEIDEDAVQENDSSDYVPMG